MPRIGVLLGSVRAHGNGRQIWQWVLEHLQCKFPKDNYEIIDIFPNGDMHPLGPVDSDTIPALVEISGPAYGNERVQAWSSLVASCDAFVILTPQHNWGYPGDLKIALDHLYHEWRGKPVMIVAYGGHGGEKCAAQLLQVLQGLKMKVVEEAVCITLPSQYIRTNERFRYDNNDTPSFLKDCGHRLVTVISTFSEFLSQKQ